VKLLTTAEVAAELNIGEDWVREHAAELGGIRAGRGPRAPLRFERRAIEAWIERQRVPLAPQFSRKPRRPGSPAVPAGVPLLPLPTRL